MIDPIDRAMAAAIHRGAAVGSLPFLLLAGLLLQLRRFTGSPERPFVQFHYGQALRLHGALWGISLLSCGIGLLILAVPVLWMSLRAADAAGAGEWFCVPYVGGPPATSA